MGPSDKTPHFEVSRMDRIQNVTKKIIVAYFEDPLHYAFYIGLLGLMVSTIFGYNPPLTFWGIMAGLTGYKIYHYYLGNKKQNDSRDTK